MTDQRFGKIVVTGTPAQLALAAKVYGSVVAGHPFPGDLEPKDFPIQFHTGQEMYDLGAIIPNSRKSPRFPKGQPAYGFTFSTALAINADIRPVDQSYALEHEPFHPIIATNMTQAKRAQLLPLVEKVAGGTPYQNRLSEVLCDAFVELFYGHSVLDNYYGDIADADLQKAWDILMAPETNPVPVPPEPPVPLPLPDPQIAELAAEVSRLNTLLDQIHELSAPAGGTQ